MFVKIYLFCTIAVANVQSIMLTLLIRLLPRMAKVILLYLLDLIGYVHLKVVQQILVVITFIRIG